MNFSRVWYPSGILGKRKKERIPSVLSAYLSGNPNDDILYLHTKNVRRMMAKQN